MYGAQANCSPCFKHSSASAYSTEFMSKPLNERQFCWRRCPSYSDKSNLNSPEMGR